MANLQDILGAYLRTIGTSQTLGGTGGLPLGVVATSAGNAVQGRPLLSDSDRDRLGKAHSTRVKVLAAGSGLGGLFNEAPAPQFTPPTFPNKQGELLQPSSFVQPRQAVDTDLILNAFLNRRRPSDPSGFTDAQTAQFRGVNPGFASAIFASP